MIEIWNRGLLDDDEKGYPDDRSGFYSTVDICKIFGFAMETLQQWMKDGFVRPAYRIKFGCGLKSVFVKSQLLWIGVFRELIKLGISRDKGAKLSNFFFIQLKSSGKFDAYHHIALEYNDYGIVNLTALSEAVKIEISPESKNNFIYINIDTILNKISSFA